MRLGQAAATALLRLLLLLGLSTKGWSLRVSGVVVPSAVVSGSSVKLMCNYERNRDREDPLYSVKWYRGVHQFYEYIPGRKPSVRVFKLPHITVDQEGSSGPTVWLSQVTRGTSGIFRCEVMGDKPFFETDDHAVNMTVVDVPTWGPEITGVVKGTDLMHSGGVDRGQGRVHGQGVIQGSGVLEGARVRPGDVVAARCQVGFSDPPADITWTISAATPIPHTQIQRSRQTDQHGRRSQVSEVEAVVRESWFSGGAVTLSCHVEVSSVYHQATNVTLIHADHPQPAGFGWFSSGSSPWVSLSLLTIAMLLSLLLV
ncbi:uncharacterized protein LOC121871049 [Homarus americanus]|nr:uncharacterized protein LOC121871049 [Homarus americanus]